MNVENNQLNYKYKKHNVYTMTKSDTRLREFLAKYTVVSVSEEKVRHEDCKPESKNSSRKMIWKKISKDLCSTPESASRPNIGDILQEFTTKFDNNEDMRKTYRNDGDPNEEVLDYYDYNIDYVQDRSASKRNYTCCSRNIRNLGIYLAQSQNKVSFGNNNKNGNSKNDTAPSSSNNYDSKNNGPDNKTYAEKTTYCRPVYNMSSQELIYQTMERNAKLQLLLKKLILVRRREKEREEWNNYVNELKNKHSYYSNEPQHIAPQYVPQERTYYEPMTDYCSPGYSQPCRSLLHDLYGYTNASNYPSRANGYYDLPEYERVRENSAFGYVYENEPSCYPTSSQGRLMMLRRERLLDPCYKNMPVHRNRNNPNVIVVDRDLNAYRKKRKNSSDCGVCPCCTKKECILINNTAQTDDIAIATCSKKYDTTDKVNFTSKDSHVSFTILNAIRGKTESETKHEAKHETNENITHETNYDTKDETKDKRKPREKTTKEKYDEVTEKVNRLKEIVESNELKIQHKKSLMSIESKLDTLLKSLKSFESKKLQESTSKSTLTDKITTLMKQSSAMSDTREVDAALRRIGSDAFVKKIAIVGNTTTNTSSSVLQTRQKALGQLSSTTRIENILYEELDKSNQLRKEIAELLYTQVNQPCAVQISFDIPTKERATEVTASLSKTKLSDADKRITIEEVRSDHEDDRQMTIAVNTDPMGLLALFRVSSEAIKQLMSYMPNVDYGWYLSRIPLPQLSGGRMPQYQYPEYVCNICGAVFAQSYQLSDHIQRHNLSGTKDCCVCRHVLDVKRRNIGRFTCQYCGKRFSRAYCCELHQQSCARAQGKQHDVTPSLTLLV